MLAKLLLEKGANVDSEDSSRRTPLLCAAKNGHEAVVTLLLELGAEVDSKDNRGQTPLLYAAKKRHEALVNATARTGR